jgi:hypothetical protein
MPEAEILLTMTEVAVAFAGFTALASVLSGRRSHDHPTVASYFLRAMIETALLVVFFSLLPLILGATPLAVNLVWRVSAGACAVCWLGTAALYTRDGRTIQRDIGFAVDRRWATPTLAALIIGNGAFLLTATGLLDTWAGGAYSIGLFCLLMISAASFARFFFGVYERLSE